MSSADLTRLGLVGVGTRSLGSALGIASGVVVLAGPIGVAASGVWSLDLVSGIAVIGIRASDSLRDGVIV